MIALKDRLTYANVTATLALSLALGGGTYTALGGIPAPDGVIRACYHKKKGNLRVVPAGAACRKPELELTWNQQGQPGAPGIQGDPGTPAATVFAWVDQTATLRRSSTPAPTVAHPLTGVYELTFPTLDLSGCVAIATPGQASNNGFNPTTQLDARIDSDPGHGGDIHTVIVFPTNASTGAVKDASFNVAVFC